MDRIAQWLFEQQVLLVRDGVLSVVVRVTASASENCIYAIDAAGVVKVRISAPPVDGKANEAVVGCIADAFELPSSCVSIARGHTSRTKVLRIRLSRG